MLRLRGLEVSFVPGEPARLGTFVAYEPVAHDKDKTKGKAQDNSDGALGSPEHGLDLDDKLEILVRRGTGFRRQRVRAARLQIGDAIVALRDARQIEGSVASWSAVVTAGLGILAEGRLYPGVSPEGFDTWHAGPFSPGQLRLLTELCAAFPPSAYCLALGAGAPPRVRGPESLVRACWDAMADTLARSAAAPLVAGGELYAAVAPQSGEHLRPWLVDAARGIEGGANVALRVELDAEMPRAVLQLTSRAESSLVVDASELFSAPASVLARFGEDAESDLLLCLRRGARAWPALGTLLAERVPTELELDEDMLADLLSDGATMLQGTGIDVLWPAEVLTQGIKLRAAITPTPGKVDDAGFALASLLSFTWQATLDGELLSPEEIDQLAEAKRGLVRLRGRFVAADPALLERLRAARPGQMSAIEALAAVLAGSIELDGEPVEVVATGALAELAERLSRLGSSSSGSTDRGDAGAPEGAIAVLAPPAGLRAELRPYQARGVTWLAEMTSTGLGGCLADDMGLGKTLQVIALHLHRAAAHLGPTLVVCPTSLVGNWEREVHRFAPGTPVRRYHGAGRQLESLGHDELVVTSYGVARLDTAALRAAGFSLVVADEAQHAKNPHSATARRLREIPATSRLALTGTPVENRLSELWAILDWTTPGLLGPLERFVRHVATPIERYRDPTMTDRLARTVQPFLLRRRKTDPAIAPDLPARTVSDLPVPLTAEQVTLYEAEVREALAAIAAKDGIARQGLVLRLLTVLKQICNHPAQYLHQPGPLAGRSGKLAALEELAATIVAAGDSALVFSQFVECAELIEARLGELGVPTLFLHGKVPARSRQVMVDAFQAGDVPIFLLSLKAGGVGLNLTRANHVVHYDRWWNPAVEDQATDRAHRIGQRRAVQVYRLVAEGTLEDRIAELIEKKRSLAEAVAGGGESWIGQLDDAALAELVSLGSGR